jgi:hypothetical protein
VREERAESESGKESGKIWGQNGGREECRIVTECWREKKKNKEKKERRENYYQRNGYPSEDVKRLRAEGRWKNVKLSERDKDTDKQERRERIKESRYNRGSIKSTWEERVQEKGKWWRDSDVGTRREKTGIEWKERKEGERERERKERGEILNKDGREIRWWKRHGRGRKEQRGGTWE